MSKMPPATFVITSLDFPEVGNLWARISEFVADHVVVISLPDFSFEVLSEWWANFLAWLLRPDVLAIITAWWITFTVVMFLCLVGFGPFGIAAGSAAAAFQSWAYGGFTPAGGIFATLTSMGMLGILNPFLVILACLIATAVAVLAWKIGLGVE